MSLALILAAALSTISPQGHRLELGAEVQPPPWAVLQVMALTGKGAAALRVDRQPGYWRRIYLSADSNFVWPQGQSVSLICEKGASRPTQLFAMSPEPDFRPIDLGKESVLMRVDELWHGRSGRTIVLWGRWDPSDLKGEVIGLEAGPKAR